jgi:hypothetical protein
LTVSLDTVKDARSSKEYRRLCFLFGQRFARRALQINTLAAQGKALAEQELEEEDSSIWNAQDPENWELLERLRVTSKDERNPRLCERKQAEVGKFNARVHALQDKYETAVMALEEEQQWAGGLMAALEMIRQDNRREVVAAARDALQRSRRPRLSWRQCRRFIIDNFSRGKWFTAEDVIARIKEEWPAPTPGQDRPPE